MKDIGTYRKTIRLWCVEREGMDYDYTQSEWTRVGLVGFEDRSDSPTNCGDQSPCFPPLPVAINMTLGWSEWALLC